MIILDPKKFSQLPVADPLDGSESIPIIQDGINKKTTVDDLPGGGGGGVQSIVAGDNITVDDTDPENPIVSSTGGGGAVDSVNGETGVVVLDQDDIGDGVTYKQYSDAEKTKLGSIEAGADVTDATNVAAAGAFMKSVDDTDDITVGANNKFATAAEKTKLGLIAVTQDVDLDTMESDIANKQPLDADLTALAAAGNSSVLAATTASFLTADETKLDGIEALADVTDAGNVGSSIDGAASKTTPVDADTMPLIDSAAANVLKKLTWANLKATLKTYFDTLYGPALGFTPENVANKDTDGTLAANSDTKYASQKATKAYVDAQKRAPMIMKTAQYKLPITSATATTSSAMVAGTFYCHAFPIPSIGVTTLTDILIELTTGAAATGRFGLFKITDGKDPQSGLTLVADLGTVDLTTTAVKETVVSQVCNDEWAMIGIYVPSASPVFRAYNTTGNAGTTSFAFIGLHDSTNYAQYRPTMGWYVAGIDYSAGMPSTIASLTRINGGAKASPLIAARFSY